MLSVARDSAKDHASGIDKIETALWLICFWASLPEELLNFKTLTLSGITREDYPLVHSLLFQNHSAITLLLLILWFVVTTLSLTRKHLRY